MQTKPNPFPYRVIDLTHGIHQDIPLMPGDPPLDIAFGAGAGVREVPEHHSGSDVSEEPALPSRRFQLAEHAGTHLDAPSHFMRGGIGVDRIDLDKLLVPGVLIDMRERSATEPGFRLTVNDFLLWEEEHGFIPPHALVILHTGWGFRWSQGDSYLATDEMGAMTFPGFGAEVAEFLATERFVVGLGIDTPSIDVGRSTSYPSHQVILGKGLYCVENLANCYLLPPRDFMVVVAPLKLQDAAGSPARVFALVPVTAA